MSIDAVALLRIAKLPAPRSAIGVDYLVDHRGDASLLHSFVRFDSLAPDEHALQLRKLLGTALDAHDDARGVLLFPDIAEPSEQSYDAIVARVASAGVWAPLVGAGHVPERYSSPPAGSHDALVSRLVATWGLDKATELDQLARVELLVSEATGGRADAVDGAEAVIAQLKSALGSEFAERYARSLRQQIDAENAAQQARFGRMGELFARGPDTPRRK